VNDWESARKSSIPRPVSHPDIVRSDVRHIYRGTLKTSSRKRQYNPLALGEFFVAAHTAHPDEMLRLGKFVSRVDDATIKVSC
jgi:hypothetical protein